VTKFPTALATAQDFYLDRASLPEEVAAIENALGVNLSNVPQGGGGGQQVLLSASITLTAAQLKTLLGTPIQIVAAPGVGKMLLPLQCVYQYKYITPAYTIGTNEEINIFPQGGNPFAGNFNQWFSNFSATGLLDQTHNVVFAPGTASQTTDVQSIYENKALMVGRSGSAEWTNGNGTLTVTLIYAVVTLQ
jgi:hypothetical protein